MPRSQSDLKSPKWHIMIDGMGWEKGQVPVSLQSRLQSETNSLIASSNFFSTERGQRVDDSVEIMGTGSLRQSCFQHFCVFCPVMRSWWFVYKDRKVGGARG